MSRWYIQKGSRKEEYTEKKLRAKLRKGDLSGVELVRREDEEQWTPLHDRPIFTEEVAHTGDARMVAWTRQAQGFGWHLLIFLGVMSFLSFPWWGIFWGLGVLGHLGRTVPAALGLMAVAREQIPAPIAAAALAAVTPTAAPAPAAPTFADATTDPFIAQLDVLLGELEASGEPTAEVRSDALALHERRVSFDAVLSGFGVAAMEEELAGRRAEAEAGTDGLSREIAALEVRLEAAREASAARDRLASQERELLHHLESIRLSILRARLEEGGSENASSRLADIRRRLAAESEVDEKLAAARRSASRQRS